jgi:hypothetical protein
MRALYCTRQVSKSAPDSNEACPLNTAARSSTSFEKRREPSLRGFSRDCPIVRVATRLNHLERNLCMKLLQNARIILQHVEQALLLYEGPIIAARRCEHRVQNRNFSCQMSATRASSATVPLFRSFCSTGSHIGFQPSSPRASV